MRQAITQPGLAPMIVAPVRSARDHCQATSGHIGLPSTMTIEARTSSELTSAFHIIQAVVENHSIRSSGPMSHDSAWFFRCSSRMPPWPWTIAFGWPVVPEEKSTNSGWSNGTASNAIGSGVTSRSRACQSSASGTA
ncbi:hypothetical protein GCM10025862_01400 [Arsenicicoccus piscis]|uniref:Uncharacterized protein n=1 Tax=Arsenicicoccus piscis TaxID=673954 RepID=A0ABQ6HKA5_9MICO|nr:hypothetical protein GCM10025862_01400 [Arsenicicoccus piscis]